MRERNHKKDWRERKSTGRKRRRERERDHKKDWRERKSNDRKGWREKKSIDSKGWREKERDTRKRGTTGKVCGTETGITA